MRTVLAVLCQTHHGSTTAKRQKAFIRTQQGEPKKHYGGTTDKQRVVDVSWSVQRLAYHHSLDNVSICMPSRLPSSDMYEPQPSRHRGMFISYFVLLRLVKRLSFLEDPTTAEYYHRHVRLTTSKLGFMLNRQSKLKEENILQCDSVDILKHVFKSSISELSSISESCHEVHSGFGVREMERCFLSVSRQLVFGL